MLINVTFNKDKITATTEVPVPNKLSVTKKSARVHRDYKLSASENANKAVEKLIAKTDFFEPLKDIEFVIHSKNDGYVYISMTDTYTTTFITNGIKEVN